VQPQGSKHWDLMNIRPLLQVLRSGETMVLKPQSLIDKLQPGRQIYALSIEEDSGVPKGDADSASADPIDSRPADVAAIVVAYAEAKPGVLLSPPRTSIAPAGSERRPKWRSRGRISSREICRTRSGDHGWLAEGPAGGDAEASLVLGCNLKKALPSVAWRRRDLRRKPGACGGCLKLRTSQDLS
jgi:hypothetical protein